jgi:hypothetical protein
MNRKYFANLIYCLIIATAACLASCKPEEEILTHKPENLLRFSDDSVWFDTVFTDLRTKTIRLRVYNSNKNAINLSSVALQNAGASPFSIIVNGQKGSGKLVSDVEIEGGDSIWVLVEAKLPANKQNLPLIVEDQLLFSVNGVANAQKIPVFAYGQDAHYLRDSVLNCNAVWTSDKPYVIFESVLVKKGCKLVVEAGTRVHSFKSSNIFVKGTLEVNGTKDQPVIFEGTRLEKEYEEQPDQWGAIVLFDSSANNYINHAIIRNGLRGVQVGFPNTYGATLLISNSTIRNMSEVGIFAFGSLVTMFNCEVSDCAQYLFAGIQGGNYALWHNTLAYSGNKGFQRKTPAVAFTNFYKDPATSVLAYSEIYPRISMVNNIITGPLADELTFAVYPENTALGPVPPEIKHNIIRTATKTIRNYDVETNILVANNYQLKNTAKYNFRLDSVAVNRDVAYQKGQSLDKFGSSVIEQLLSKDKSGVNRSSTAPDIGAYQY